MVGQIVAITAAVFGLGAGEASGSAAKPQATPQASAVSAEPTFKPLTLMEARHQLGQRRQGDPSISTVAGIDLGGYNFDYETELGNGMRCIFVSSNAAGGILLFDQAGSLLSSARTRELVGVQLVDVDQDGIAEAIVEQVDDSGTGIRLQSYHCYSFTNGKIVDIWHGKSLELIYGGRGHATPAAHRLGFVHVQLGGFGRGPQLVHVVYDVRRRATETTTFDFVNGHVQKAAP